MSHGNVRDDLSRRTDLRRFGLVVGASLVVLAGLIRYGRHSFYVPAGMAVIGLLLLTCATLSPALLAPVRGLWMTLAAGLAWLNARILLTIVFYLIVTPTALLLRLLRRDPMRRRWREPGAQSYWIRRPGRPCDPDDFRRQF